MATEQQSSPLDQALADILLNVQESAGQAKDFLVSEIPEVVQELLMWTLVSSLSLAVLLIAGAVAAWKIGLPALKNKESWAYDTGYGGRKEISLGGGFFLGGTVVYTGIIVPVSIINIATALKVWVAPKIFLIEYAARLM